MICARLSPTLLRHWSVRHTQSFGTVTQQSDYTLEMKNLTLHNWIQKKKGEKIEKKKSYVVHGWQDGHAWTSSLNSMSWQVLMIN